MGMFDQQTEDLRRRLAEQMTHTNTAQPGNATFRKMWPDIEQTLWDMSPIVGDAMAIDRGARGYASAINDIARGDVLQGLSRVPQATVETISAVPGIGDLAAMGKAGLDRQRLRQVQFNQVPKVPSLAGLGKHSGRRVGAINCGKTGSVKLTARQSCAAAKVQQR